MVSFFRKNVEPNKTVRVIEAVILVALVFSSIFAYAFGTLKVNKDVGELSYVQEVEMKRDPMSEECDLEQMSVCEVLYQSSEGEMYISYSYEEYEALEDVSIKAYEFESQDGHVFFFDRFLL